MSEDAKKLIETEAALYRYSGEDRIILSDDMREMLAGEKKAVVTVKTGIPSLDVILGGFEGGELIVISGITGNGKTLFCQTLTRNIWNQGVYCIWFSYEVTPAHFLRQFGDTLPAFCLPAKLKGNSLAWLNQRIHEAKLKYEARVIFIDHLHFLIELSRNGNMSLEIGAIMRGLKKIALHHNIVIVLVAHTSKVRAETELDLDLIRDSSFIAQEADNVLFVWRTKEEGEAILKVAKNRKLGIINKKIRLKKIDGILREIVEARNEFNDRVTKSL